MEDPQEQDVVVLTLGERDHSILLFRDGSRVRLRCSAFRSDGVSVWSEMPCVDPSGRTSFLSEVDVEDLPLEDDDDGIDFDMGEHGSIRVELVATTPTSATLMFQLEAGCSVTLR
jgi:hypothetical protein